MSLQVKPVQSIAKLFGNRVALVLEEEAYDGLIVPPANRDKIYVLSKVIAVGDPKCGLVAGDVVFWQTNAMIDLHCRYSMNGVPVFVLMAGDMIAKVFQRKVNLGTFEVVGDWCLLKKEVVQPNKIILPVQVADNSQDVEMHFHLLQKGNTVGDDLAVGDEVIIDRTRANLFKLGDVPVYYIHKNFVLGTISNAV